MEHRPIEDSLRQAQDAFTRDRSGNTSAPLSEQAAKAQRDGEAQQDALNKLSRP